MLIPLITVQGKVTKCSFSQYVWFDCIMYVKPKLLSVGFSGTINGMSLTLVIVANRFRQREK